MMFKLLIRSVVFGLPSTAVIAQVAPNAGEGFSVGIVSHRSVPRLASARLESGEPGLSDIRPGDTIIYPRGSRIRVPEIITFVWTAKGEEGEHRAEFRLREQVPSQVFELIASRKRPPHTLFIDFLVVNGRPECHWSYYRFEGKGITDGTELGRGVVAGEILP